jgi:hypothetical protein
VLAARQTHRVYLDDTMATTTANAAPPALLHQNLLLYRPTPSGLSKVIMGGTIAAVRPATASTRPGLYELEFQAASSSGPPQRHVVTYRPDDPDAEQAVWPIDGGGGGGGGGCGNSASVEVVRCFVCVLPRVAPDDDEDAA